MILGCLLDQFLLEPGDDRLPDGFTTDYSAPCVDEQDGLAGGVYPRLLGLARRRLVFMRQWISGAEQEWQEKKLVALAAQRRRDEAISLMRNLEYEIESLELLLGARDGGTESGATDGQ